MASTNPNDRDNLNKTTDAAIRDRRDEILDQDRVRSNGVVEDRDTNPDAITGAPGSHPVGTAVGAAGAGAGGTWAGAAIGMATGGPIGAVVGGVIGAVAGAVGGGLAGKAVAESIDPTEEDAYWSAEHVNRPYYKAGHTYEEDYAPAYRQGYTARDQYRDREFDDVESDLGADWDRSKGKSKLKWEEARSAVRDAWDRVSNKVDRAAYPDRKTDDQASQPNAVRSAPRPDLRDTAVDPRNM